MRDNSEPKQKISKEKKDKKILIKLQKEKNHSTNTIQSIKETLDAQSKYQTINQISKSFNMSMDENKINIKENSKPKTRNYSKISKIPSSLIHNNNESSLLKNLQFLDSDNVKLREALKEINKELQLKEEALNESQKLLKKINNEYTQILNQYKTLEEERKYLKKDNERLQKICNILTKNLNNKEKKEKQNEKIKAELIKTKELLNNLKENFNNATNDFNKKEKDIKNKEMIIKDLKIEGNKIVHMLQDRELLIKEYNIKINELNDIIKQKDEQLKLMLNFSKELNDENKTNIKEITKQAVKTISTFYNTRKNKEEQNKINLIQIKNEMKNNLNNRNDNSNITSKKNCSFLFNKAIKNDLFIPNIELNSINKEFLEANNFKTSLIKTELYSSILREFHLFGYINDFFNKSNEYLKNWNLSKNDKQGKSIKSFKNCYDKLVNSLMKYKKENSFLKSKINELTLYIKKLQNDFSGKNKKIKEQLEKLQIQYISYIKKLKTKNQNNNKDNNCENKDVDYSKEISELNKEIDKINNINHNLNEEILIKDEIINKLRNENNKLNNKINLYRTNPNAENNIKFYNSYSTKPNSINPNNLFSENYYFQYNTGEDLKLNTHKVLSQNNIFDSFNNKDDLSKNNQEYSKNKKNDNDDLMKFKTQNYYNENCDFSNTYIKSNNYNENNFVNLEIQVQDEFTYYSNNNINNNKQKKFYSNIDNSKFNDIENLNNISKIIKNFTKKISEDRFIDIINKIFSSVNIILMLNNKIGEIKNNLSQIKEKFRNSNKEKKIKPSQLIDVLDEVEKLLFYLFNQLNKFNIDSQSIFPFLKIIFNMVSAISFNNPLEINNINNNLYNITPINIDINTLINTTSSNYNNKFNTKKNFKDKILQNNINQKISEINIRIFKNIFYINNKIFSSSELIKYYSIYEGLDISELISVFKEICDNFKNIILNSKFNYDTDLSDWEENNEDIGKTKDNNEIITDNNTYHIVNEKIFGLKKFEFNFKLFFELLKNYLIVFEIVVKQIEINIQNIQRKKELEKVLNNLYEIFEDSSYLNINNLDDNTIFCRKILLTLLLNQKEYLSHFI